jgi:hypothetical protein
MKTLKIESRENISQAEFHGSYFMPQKPMVFKGLANKFPAGEKWTTDYLKQVCGDVIVDVFDSSNPNRGSAYTKADLKMPFSEYLENITGNEPSKLRMFLFNMFKCKPELRKDFPCPSIFKGLLGKVGYMFFGAKDIKVRIHQDIDMSNVLLTQFKGKKKVILVAPEYSTLLYRLPLNTYALVDLEQPDYRKYPGLAFLETYECVLEPGDTLFMPSGFWHQVTYLEGGFAVSYRKLSRRPKLLLKGILSLLLYMPLDKLLNKLGGVSWLAKKEQIADAAANRLIEKIKREPAWKTSMTLREL